MSNNDDFMNYVGYQTYGGGNDPAFSGERENNGSPVYRRAPARPNILGILFLLYIIFMIICIVFGVD